MSLGFHLLPRCCIELMAEVRAPCHNAITQYNLNSAFFLLILIIRPNLMAGLDDWQAVDTAQSTPTLRILDYTPDFHLPHNVLSYSIIFSDWSYLQITRTLNGIWSDRTCQMRETSQVIAPEGIRTHFHTVYRQTLSNRSWRHLKTVDHAINSRHLAQTLQSLSNGSGDFHCGRICAGSNAVWQASGSRWRKQGCLFA